MFLNQNIPDPPAPYDKCPLSFARKLIRPFGSATSEDIENEVRAITQICASGVHQHIIRFLSHGSLPASDYYYIDMECCNFNLENYIHTTDHLDLIAGLSIGLDDAMRESSVLLAVDLCSGAT